MSFLLNLIVLNAQQMRIGVLRDHSIKRITFSYNDGSYAVFADTNYFGVILPNEFVELNATSNGFVKLKIGAQEFGEFSKVLLVQTLVNTSLTLTSKTPVVKARKYKDDFEISCKSNALTVVNLVEMDNYLAGVVESEGGGGKNLEYYKVQAIMSRSYALKYLDRHKKDGFQLCDRVHCQAYHSMMRFTPTIDSAVVRTHNLVLTDTKEALIDSYFHANCGGQTCEPQYVWNESIPYLSSFKDTFCVYTKQATWETRISQEKWKRFLVNKYNFPIQDSICASMMFNFIQDDRKAFYLDPIFGIPLRDLREEFNLKSTYFSCRPDGEDVVINGRGFGHGVGLCQEGAMKMARSGYDFKQILLFYFPGSKVIDWHDQKVFDQKSVGLSEPIRN
ncbi:MAG: SpoIID/LytB domain-containing protein [Crocinitomicaceae bacterium]|jgi:stage II sporulation protein D|nr:SpoIID/LytB domain-containing protein [Crocinitomicaceae bacterium]